MGTAGGAGCGRENGAALAASPQRPAGEVWLTPRQINDALVKEDEAAFRQIGRTLLSSGRVVFDDQRVTHVFSPVTGRIASVEAELGARLVKGAPLATIDSPDVGMATAELDKAHADLVAAEHEYKRQRELFDAHAGAQKDYEAAQDSYLRAKAEMERAQQKAKLLRTGSIDRVTQAYVLRTSLAGEVVARTATPGMEVQGQYSGGSAVELFTIGELDPVWVFADIFEMDLAKVRAGQKASVQVIAYQKPFEGVVDWVSGTLDPATRTAKARCVIPNPDRLLKPEMFATVSLDVEGRRALTIPKTSVLRIADHSFAFVSRGRVDGGYYAFQRRPVVVDQDQPGDFVEVTEGVVPGERVVTSGAILLSGML